MISNQAVAVSNERVEDVFSKHLDNPAVRNADNECLGQLRGGGFTIGHVDEVNGHGAEEIQAFVATRHELIQLLKYWAKKAIDIDYDRFFYEQPGSSDRRVRAFGWRRVSRIAEIVGKEEGDEAVKQAYEEYGKGQHPRTWNIFLNGTAAEREIFRKEMNAFMRGDVSAA
jgi:hypothetical protein